MRNANWSYKNEKPRRVLEYTPSKEVKVVAQTTTFGDYMTVPFGTKQAVDALFGSVPGYVVCAVNSNCLMLKRA